VSVFQGFWLRRIDHLKHGIGLNNIWNFSIYLTLNTRHLILETDLLILYREIIALYCENHTKHLQIICDKCRDFECWVRWCNILCSLSLTPVIYQSIPHIFCKHRKRKVFFMNTVQESQYSRKLYKLQATNIQHHFLSCSHFNLFVFTSGKFVLVFSFISVSQRKFLIGTNSYLSKYYCTDIPWIVRILC
jgi:hypothetical protein